MDNFSSEGGVPCPKILINLPGPIRSYRVKENHIGSAVSEIVWYTRHRSCYFITRIELAVSLKCLFEHRNPPTLISKGQFKG